MLDRWTASNVVCAHVVQKCDNPDKLFGAADPILRITDRFRDVTN